MRTGSLFAIGLMVAACACAEQRTAVKPATTAPSQAFVDPPPPPPGAPTVMLLELEGAEEEEGAGYTPFARRGLLASRRAAVVLKRELLAQLGSCEDADCSEEVSAQLAAARYIVSGGVGRVGGTYVVQLKLLDATTSAVLARVSRQGSDDPEGLVFEAAREIGAAIPEG